MKYDSLRPEVAKWPITAVRDQMPCIGYFQLHRSPNPYNFLPSLHRALVKELTTRTS